MNLSASVFMLSCGLFLVSCSSIPKEPVAPIAVENPEHIECTEGTDVRVLEVEHVSLGCTLNYSKQGKVEKVTASGSGPQACLSQLQNIKRALITAGYACR